MFGVMSQNLCKNQKNPSSFGFNYCGTCKSMGQQYSQKSRLFLNYDIVFLSSLLNELQGEKNFAPAYYEKSCWNLPKQNEIPLVFQYTSALNVYLASIKILDNIKDSKYLKKAQWISAKLFYKRSINSAKQKLKELGFPIKKVEILVNESFEREKQRNLSLNDYAEPTYTITEIAFQHGAKLLKAQETDIKLMTSLGNHLGKLAYYLDARTDLIKDKEEKNFNPIIASSKVTTQLVVNEIDNQCTEMSELLQTSNFSDVLKSNYMLRLAGLFSGSSSNNQQTNNSNSDNCDCCGCCCEGCSACAEGASSNPDGCEICCGSCGGCDCDCCCGGCGCDF